MDPASSALPAATNARWAMLNELVCCRDESIVADAKTVADCRTSAFGGGQLRFSMAPAAPPESSFLCYDWTGSAEHDPRQFSHGDSVLLQAIHTAEGFVYRAGAATRPPSLSQLLPARDLPSVESIGLLRRGEDELLVAQLEVTAPIADADTFLAEVWVLHVGRHEWELKPATPIILDDDEGDGAVKRDKLRRWTWSWHTYMGGGKDNVVPVGNRFLCWVDYNRGFVLLCDMAEERSRLRYVPLPVVPPPWTHFYEGGRRSEIEYSRDICGVGVGVLKFVSIDLRCCCCCAQSTNAFLVTTWTLALEKDDGPMAWVKDAALDCEELWALPGYDGLPRVPPTCPVVSLDNPDVVCFSVGEIEFESFGKRKVWMVEVDIRKKALLSVVVRYTCYPHDFDPHLPVKLHY